MKLMTEELKNKFKKFPLYSQEGELDNAEVVVKYFTPDAQATWLITEGNELEDGDWEFFGYCYIHEWEWGYVMLSDIKSVRGKFGLPVEIDLSIPEGSRVKDLKD